MLRTPIAFAASALLLASAPGAALAQTKSEAAKERARMESLRAQARSYRCVTQAGRKYYGSTIPQQCKGEPVEALSAQGTLLFRIDPPPTAEQRAAREAEEKKAAAAEIAKRDAQRAVQVQARRDQALLQTYASEDDIEMVRRRAIADNRAATAQVEARIAQLKSRQDQLAKEATKYKDPGEVPEKFQQDVKAIAYDLSLQDQLLASRRKEAAEINARYDEEKRKYHLLTNGGK